MKRDTPQDRFRWDHWACVFLFSVMSLIAFANILSRYFFHRSFAFTEEITVNCFVFLMIIGSGLAFERGNHLGMVTLFDRLPRRWKAGVLLLSAVLGALLYVAVDLMLLRAILFQVTRLHGTSSGLGIPIWVYYSGVVLASVAVFQGILRGLRIQLKLNQEDQS